jgi:signal transduction histidine kinase
MPENDALQRALKEIDLLRSELAGQQETQQKNIKMLQDNKEELLAQKEELAAMVDELSSQNRKLVNAFDLLRQRNNEMDQIIYRASHDLKGPATSILGINNLLQNYSGDAFIDDCCSHIDFQLLKMNALLNSLSSFSHVAISEPHMDPVDFHFILNDALEECSQIPFSNTMSVLRNLEDNLTFRSDSHFIRVILYELLSNAFIFRNYEKDGTVSVDVRMKEDTLTIRIHDGGDGIQPDIRKKIFNMFYRGSDKSLGNGLGLYKVKKCIEALKGTIGVRHEGGTEFTVTLPVEYYRP